MKKIKPPSKKLIEAYWQIVEDIENEYANEIDMLEERMRKETGIEDLEFFYGLDGGICGIGNASRTMDLIDRWRK